MEENTSLTAAAGDQNTGSAVPKPTTAISSSSTGGGSLLVTDNAAGQVSTNEGQDQATREISKKQALEGGLEEAAMPASTDARTNITHSKEAAPNSDTNDTSRPDSLSNQPSPGPPAAPIERSPLDCGNLQLLLEACVPSSKPTDEETYSTAAVQPQQQYPQDEESQPTEGISANPSKTIDAQQQPVRDPVRPEPSAAPKSPVRHPQPHISQSMSSSKGGFFDDAAERGRIFDDASPRPATSSSPPAKKAKLSEGTVPSPPKCGGIFDDAEDDDMDFEAPTYEPQASVKIPKKDAPLPSLPSSFDSASIGLPPPPPKSRMDVHNSALERPLAPKNNSSGVAPGNHAIKSSLDNASSFSSSAAAPIVDVSQKKDMSKEKQPAKKKKPTKPVKRVLVARKERDAAVLLLAKADDLVRVIAPEHSTFLGEELWIFTIGQLEYVLDQSFPSESGLVGWVAANQLNKSPTRADLLRKVAMSKLVSECANGTTESSKQVKDDDAIKGRPNLDAEKNSKETAVDSMHQGAGVDEKATAAAEAILKGWKEAIEEWKMKNEKVPLKEKFLLDGPISCIFPPVARNFFASMTPPLKSLYEFLSLKKTETGAVIALCVAWRKQCGLPDATPLAIAKYLIGLSFRTEAAVSVPPPGAFARRWMSEPIGMINSPYVGLCRIVCIILSQLLLSIFSCPNRCC